MFLRVLCLLGVCSLLAAHENVTAPQTPQPVIQEPTFIRINETSEASTLLAKVALNGFEAFYGTAIYFHSTENHIYYLTNAHVVPDGGQKRRRLLLIGSTTGNQFARAKVVAT